MFRVNIYLEDRVIKSIVRWNIGKKEREVLGMIRKCVGGVGIC